MKYLQWGHCGFCCYRNNPACQSTLSGPVLPGHFAEDLLGNCTDSKYPVCPKHPPPEATAKVGVKDEVVPPVTPGQPLVFFRKVGSGRRQVPKEAHRDQVTTAESTLGPLSLAIQDSPYTDIIPPHFQTPPDTKGWRSRFDTTLTDALSDPKQNGNMYAVVRSNTVIVTASSLPRAAALWDEVCATTDEPCKLYKLLKESK